MAKSKKLSNAVMRGMGLVLIWASASHLEAQERRDAYVGASTPPIAASDSGLSPDTETPYPPVQVPSEASFDTGPGFYEPYHAGVVSVSDGCDCFRCRFAECKRRTLRSWLSWCHRHHRHFINPVCPPGCMPGYGHFPTKWRPFEAHGVGPAAPHVPSGAWVPLGVPEADVVPAPEPSTRPHPDLNDDAPLPGGEQPDQPPQPEQPQPEERQVEGDYSPPLIRPWRAAQSEEGDEKSR